MQHVRQKSTPSSRIKSLSRALENIVRRVVGRKWGNRVALNVSTKTESITIQIRDLANNKLNQLNTAIREFVRKRSDVRYCPQRQQLNFA